MRTLLAAGLVLSPLAAEAATRLDIAARLITGVAGYEATGDFAFLPSSTTFSVIVDIDGPIHDPAAIDPTAPFSAGFSGTFLSAEMRVGGTVVHSLPEGFQLGGVLARGPGAGFTAGPADAAAWGLAEGDYDLASIVLSDDGDTGPGQSYAAVMLAGPLGAWTDPGVTAFDFADPEGGIIALRADAFAVGDAFAQITSITASTVPVPAAAPLLLGALGGFALLRRRAA